MIFTHHPQPGVEFIFEDWRTYPQILGNKPRGLWLSVDDDWRRWVDERIGWVLGDPVPVDVDLDRVLWIRTVDEINAFHAEFAARHDWAPHDVDYGWAIDWPTVARVHAGIVIAPHQRINFGPVADWYYPWDVASGCVWDLSAVSVHERAEAER